MEEAVQLIGKSLGPKWVQLYSSLRLDYRGRYQIQAQCEKLDEKDRQFNCAVKMFQKWRETVKDTDEKDALKRLLIAVNKIKEMQTIASELAERNGKE